MGSSTDRRIRCCDIYATRAQVRAKMQRVRNKKYLNGKIQTSRIEKEESRLQARLAALRRYHRFGFRPDFLAVLSCSAVGKRKLTTNANRPKTTRPNAAG